MTWKKKQVCNEPEAGNLCTDSRGDILPETNSLFVHEKTELTKNSNENEDEIVESNMKFTAGMFSREVWMLAFSVSVSNVAAGIGAGIIKLDPILLFIWVFAASYGLFWVGIRFGKNVRKYLTPTIVSLVASGILISLGLAQIFLD